MSMLDPSELEQLLPAESHSFPSPIPTQFVSSDEFMPAPQTERQKQVEARIKAGWTVYRVAKEAGITPAMLSRFLSDGLDLRLSTAAKLAAALGLELRSVKKKTT